MVESLAERVRRLPAWALTVLIFLSFAAPSVSVWWTFRETGKVTNCMYSVYEENTLNQRPRTIAAEKKDEALDQVLKDIVPLEEDPSPDNLETLFDSVGAAVSAQAELKKIRERYPAARPPSEVCGYEAPSS